MKAILTLATAASALVLSPIVSADPTKEDLLAATLPAPDMTYDRGEVLPVEYGVRDWEDYYAYGLPAAPAGMSWVLVDEDAYLVDPTTGKIDLVMENIIYDQPMS
ncbi:MAG: hypothetical protein CMK09_19240 [Ponticaulis sp.]|nr:hypothetical protein [Ponticaulis sp.]|tara:strand:+ start:216328 stop:216642 length:315 start_codon:yes stop_codon:yes gene_type:complete